MPPIRSLSTVKPIKTERTHEENQERAYIAASRRSDRSLEARVESARRASEIHKRRTGRSLRVTEQDVINEEMYEEEDDDLPMQYRRLTAHLQTSNAEFDRRLAAYLTNHVAMRTALGQAVNQSGAYPNSAQFANSGLQSHTPFQHHAAMGPPESTRSPSVARPSPYPTHTHGMAQAMHNRSASFATPKDLHSFDANHNQASPWNAHSDSRRNSMPTTPSGQAKKSPTSITELKFEAVKEQQAQHKTSPLKGRSDSRPQQLKLSDLPAPFEMSQNPFAGGLGSLPFSTTLPLESQQLLGIGTGFDNSDPMTAMLLGSDYKPEQAFYDYGNIKPRNNFNNDTSDFTGINQTLAPGFLDTSVDSDKSSVPSSAFTEDSSYAMSAGPFSFGWDHSFDDNSKNSNFDSTFGNGEVTPGADKEWQNLINGSAWDEQSSQQAAP